ncbi:Proline iminopeptidase [Lachnellula suecica]|uniref:Proline iminopeptidase n=1 Tax=Lachnellula suecica TaxID=602035 RepID=A0A8T9CA53_9HELO|nr:Proline iminopeptidase [Lachnellula suecica]
MAKFIDCKTHLVPGKLAVSEYFFELPKDYTNPSLGALRVFARGVRKYENPVISLSEQEASKQNPKPWLLFLQGGPGGACPPPQDVPMTNFILNKGYQILYLDQRGTGLSTAATAETLSLQGDAEAQARYLKLFRADNIVKDCEALREFLTRDYPPEFKKWSVYGQSFGGFCAFTYLSKHPEGLREVFTSGGVPPIKRSPDEVYKATFHQMIKRNKAYYTKFPEDIASVYNIALHVEQRGGIQLPAGGVLTPQRFLTLGAVLGQTGGIDKLHNMMLRMNSDLKIFGFFTRPILSAVEEVNSYDNHVIYSLIREAIYNPTEPTIWAAERVGASIEQFKWISGVPISSFSERNAPLYFSGGMVFPWMFDIYPELKKLKPVAHILAQNSEWPDLYDQHQLSNNKVPIYSASFVDDAYIDFNLAQETVEIVGNCRQYITNTMYHDAIRTKTVAILEQLFTLRDDVMD